MRFQCISCGAPRDDAAQKFAPCSYCGGLPEVSLSHDSSLLNYSVKQSIRIRLEGLDQDALDANSEASLISLYLLDGLAELACARSDRVLLNDPTNAQFLVLSAVARLAERGVSKTKIATIDDALSRLNLALSLDSGQLASEVKVIVDIIRDRFYRQNGIKPSQKLLGLEANLQGVSVPRNTVLLEIFN